jgi:hypothetical protein
VNPNSHKHKQIGTALKETEADVFGIAELNLNFPVLGPSFQWSERFRHLYRNHLVHSCNKHDTSKKQTLFGSTAQISTGASSHRAIASGADPSGLGRWVCTLFAGQDKKKLQVISGYRPNPDHADRTGSMYLQHERRLRATGDNRNPRRAFIKDLSKQLELWMDEGEMIILGLDANDNVRTGDVNAMLRIKGLVDVHAAKHPHLATESTCDKNTQEIPVDGIWATPALECISAGYYGFGELVMGKTNHRMIWADFTYKSALGFEPPKPVYRAPQRLTLTDPRVIKKYNKILRQEHTRQRLDQRAFALQESIPQGLTLQHQQEYKTLAHLDLCARRHAN